MVCALRFGRSISANTVLFFFTETSGPLAIPAILTKLDAVGLANLPIEILLGFAGVGTGT